MRIFIVKIEDLHPGQDVPRVKEEDVHKAIVQMLEYLKRNPHSHIYEDDVRVMNLL